MNIPALDVSPLEMIIAAGLLVSAWYYLLVLRSGRDFFRSTGEQGSAGNVTFLPAVTVLKPLKGLEVNLYENLETFCRQDYGRFQIVFGVADPNDAAIGVVRRLQRAFPSVDIRLAVDGRGYGANHKVSNLHNMYALARHDVIVIADSDIRVRPDYLRSVVAPLRDPAVGLVSCLYKAVPVGGLPAVLESLFINTHFSALVMAARKVEKPSYAFGATMALRRETLDAIGGFPPIANYLADDYHLGHRVSQLGLALMLSDLVVETVPDVGSWRRLLRHQVRWARTYRSVRPGGYFGSILTHGTLWALLLLLQQGLTPAAVGGAVGIVGLRLWCAAAMCFLYLQTKNTWRHMLLVPFMDLLVSGVCFFSFLGNSVTWSGNRFVMVRGGEMLEVAPTTAKTRWGRPALIAPRRSAHDSA